MKKAIAGFAAGAILATAGFAGAYGGGYIKNGIVCTGTGSGRTAGVVCSKFNNSHSNVIISRTQVIVGSSKNYRNIFYVGKS